MDTARLLRIIHAMRGKTALVLGDPILDMYHFGEVKRICPEAPVPVFVETGREHREGGAANVARNLEALGLKTVTWFPQRGLTETKHRYFVGQHLLFRVDEPVDYSDCHGEVPPVTPDVVAISDYAKGWVSALRCQAMMLLGVPVVVDPKGTDWCKYIGATVVCPNAHENVNVGDWPGTILEKRGANGMALIKNGHTSYVFLPNAKRVYDVTGAGDVVTAVMSAALAAGAVMREAVYLAGLAASWSVEHVGTVAVTAEKLEELVLCE